MIPLVEFSEDGHTLTVRVPLAHRKRGGRKLVVAPDGGEWVRARPRMDNALVKALARAHRWRKMLEAGEFSGARRRRADQFVLRESDAATDSSIAINCRGNS